jgi:hypothetical protein
MTQHWDSGRNQGVIAGDVFADAGSEEKNGTEYGGK